MIIKLIYLNRKIAFNIYAIYFRILTKNKNKIKMLGKVNILNRNVIIGKNVIIYPGVSFEGNGKIIIGDNCKIGTNTIICASKDGGVKIGNNTIVAANVYIIDANHGTHKDSLICNQKLESQIVEIGNDVWIGANSTIIKGSKIDDGAVIGGNSLVNSEINDFGIAVGIPAKIIKYRK